MSNHAFQGSMIAEVPVVVTFARGRAEVGDHLEIFSIDGVV